MRPAGEIASQVRSSSFKTPPRVTVTAGKDDKPLALAPPRYVGFDATAPVAKAIKAGESKIVFHVLSLPGFNGEATLEVTCTGKIKPKPKAKVSAASGLRVQHRSGQTFVTFTEPAPLIEGEITIKEFKELKARLAAVTPKTTFRIYKHVEPITAANIGKAMLVDEVGRLTCWNAEYMGVNQKYDDRKVVRFAVEDEKPLPRDAGLCVLNPDKAGKAYYAVSVAIDGEEDFATINTGNTASTAVEETVGSGEPVLQKVHKLDKSEHHFYAKDATIYFYTRWEAPPNGNRSDNPIDYLVGIPSNVAKPAPVYLHLHFMGGNMFGDGFWTNYTKGWIVVSSNEVPYDWWTGYHECSGTWRSWADGTVHDYTQTRLISFIDWLDGKWKIDKTRLVVEGGSMGGSGTTNLAVHRADRIAFAAGAVGIHVPANSQFTNSYVNSYGPVEWQLPFQDHKTAAFDYFSNVWYLKNHRTQSMPLLVFSNGKNDDLMGWPQALDFFRAMQETRQPHIFFWGLSGHGQGLSLPGELAARDGYRTLGMDLRTDRTQPALTRCSLDDNPGTAKAIPREEYAKIKAAAKKDKEKKPQQNERPVDPYDGDSIGQANAYLYWETDDALVIDEPNKWGLTLCASPRLPRTSVWWTSRRAVARSLPPSPARSSNGPISRLEQTSRSSRVRPRPTGTAW